MSSADPVSTAHIATAPAFHPLVADWFGATFEAPTDAQTAAWPVIRSGRDTLVAAPTGSGKTLAAFLIGIDQLIRRGEEQELDPVTRIVYVSPLKALGHDIERNLPGPRWLPSANWPSRAARRSPRFASASAPATPSPRAAAPWSPVRRTSSSPRLSRST